MSEGDIMSKAIEQLKSGLKVGHAALGIRGGVVGSVRQEVHDGDTINVRAVGNFGIRFIGVDAPEISFTLPGESKFTGLSHNKWEEFLSNPFAEKWPKFDPPLDLGLREYLESRVGSGVASNHYIHAVAAEDALEGEVLRDIEELGQTEENFQFFLVFAYDIMDRYGRLLGFINRYQPNPRKPGPRPQTYNERLLQKCKVSPYFIWPNMNPFRKERSVARAVESPESVRSKINDDATSWLARESVKDGRKQKIGIFDADNPLRLEPFEIRFLTRRNPPDRWVIDISKNDGILVNPQKYYTIPNIEDRLFIPEEYVPLFIEKGWRREAS